ncbi:MAG: hypothetical protein KA122_05340, partial [Verrucomicrobia bacterium]|nr:hypothetical protein [Verrucomicrobiota bacterium]
MQNANGALSERKERHERLKGLAPGRRRRKAAWGALLRLWLGSGVLVLLLSCAAEPPPGRSGEYQLFAR